VGIVTPAILVLVFDEACRRIGIKRPELPHSPKDYREYYGDAAAERVAAHYQPDIERFGYTFDDPARG
jgi:hypothetical protein